MVVKDTNDKKNIDKSYYDETSIVEFDNIIKGYYSLIGGIDSKYNKETSRRLKFFGDELTKKVI